MLGKQVVGFTYSKEVPVELGKVTQQLTYDTTNIRICEKIKEKKPLGRKTRPA